MTRDDIIRMAREAGMKIAIHAEDNLPDVWHATSTPELERFAALVATHVRETEFKPDWNNYQQGVKDGAAAEREECAKRCEAEADDPNNWAYERAMAGHCAAAIRARSKA